MSDSLATLGEQDPDDMQRRAFALRELVLTAVARRPAECLLLSGGLDTSILAEPAKASGAKAAVTVLASEGAADGPFAAAVAAKYGLVHQVVRTDLDGLLPEVPFVVETLKTFDPMEIRNSIVIARALRQASADGYQTAMTGDGADELFGGYSYMWDKPDGEFEAYSERLARVMRFSSIPLGQALRVEVRTPYTDPEIVAFATRLRKADKVGVHEGVRMGKYLLRLAFPEVDTRWRRKDPIEVGSGSAALPGYFDRRISREAFSQEAVRVRTLDRVEIRDPEHLAYYRVFQAVFGDHPPIPRFASDPCSKCGFELASPETNFCVTCGAWPARTVP